MDGNLTSKEAALRDAFGKNKWGKNKEQSHTYRISALLAVG